jgi:hypothetical protein
VLVLSDHLRVRWLREFETHDPSLTPDPQTEVWKDRDRRIGNLWRVSDANCKTNTTIYVNICSLISSRCTCRAVQGHTRRSQRRVVLPPKGLRSDRERERFSNFSHRKDLTRTLRRSKFEFESLQFKAKRNESKSTDVNSWKGWIVYVEFRFEFLTLPHFQIHVRRRLCSVIT